MYANVWPDEMIFCVSGTRKTYKNPRHVEGLGDVDESAHRKCSFDLILSDPIVRCASSFRILVLSERNHRSLIFVSINLFVAVSQLRSNKFIIKMFIIIINIIIIDTNYYYYGYKILYRYVTAA